MGIMLTVPEKSRAVCDVPLLSLGARGGSNGGLLMGIMLTVPEKSRAVCDVPLLSPAPRSTTARSPRFAGEIVQQPLQPTPARQVEWSPAPRSTTARSPRFAGEIVQQPLQPTPARQVEWTATTAPAVRVEPGVLPVPMAVRGRLAALAALR